MANKRNTKRVCPVCNKRHIPYESANACSPRCSESQGVLPFVSVTPQQQAALREIAECPCKYVLGIDEVGLGSWAGPVTVAGVVVPKEWSDPAVRDSKELTHNKRLAAKQIIEKKAIAYCVLSATSEEVDKEGVHKVVARLTRDIISICAYPDTIIAQDGDHAVSGPISHPHVVWAAGADSVIPAVSAASILAKVCRDDFMIDQALLFPHYGFDSNKGYRADAHIKGLDKYGPCPIHRKSYRPIQEYLRSVVPSGNGRQ